jgi:predicted O-methyltransferase YrrM
LQILALTQGARSILEIGTLGGYSTIWLARALPEGGRLVTLEADPDHADVARTNVARAGLSDVVDVRLGRALDTLPQLEADSAVPFDLVFIDADKVNYPNYYEAVLPMLADRGLIVADNVLWSGRVLDEADQSDETNAIRAFNDTVVNDPRVTCVMATVRDGVLLIRRAG